jgi:hypothetical protein
LVSSDNVDVTSDKFSVFSDTFLVSETGVVEVNSGFFEIISSSTLLSVSDAEFQVHNPWGGTSLSLTDTGLDVVGILSVLSGNLLVTPTNVEVNVAFSAVSDVNKKTGLTPVDPSDTLEKVADLPVTTWSFKDDPSATTHLGPTAQDFYQLFELGSDDRHIAPLDVAGVALAAIQGLNAKAEVSEAKQESLEIENAILTRRLAEVEKQNAEIKDRLAKLESLLR